MEFYGVQNPLLGWIKAFLSERKQRVIVNGVFSDWKEVLSGIPQGSVLGPCLFAAFINSLPDSVIGSDLFLFADDTKVFKSIFTESDCDVLQDDINNMVNWTEESLLKFHPDKCFTMRVGKSKLPARTYTIGPNNQEIKHVHVEKDIGVIIDDQLSFASHMSNKVIKLLWV